MTAPAPVSRPAYAKVNLHLGVLAKRPDGYHELETVFERVGLADQVTLEPAAGSGIELRCGSSDVPSDGTNLAARAAESFRAASGWTGGLRITLEKRIPVGGGLGGGSSDAAAVLLGLQELSGRPLPREKLMECARGLGADVAFFAADCFRALGRGRGDEIELLPAGAALHYLLVTPDFSIPTKSVYEHFRPSASSGLAPSGACLTAPGPDATLLLRALRNGDMADVRDHLYNALEPTVEQLYPAVLQVKQAIEAAGLAHPIVSGSGSTVFALAGSIEEAESAAGRVRARHPGWRACAASTQ